MDRDKKSKFRIIIQRKKSKYPFISGEDLIFYNKKKIKIEARDELHFAIANVLNVGLLCASQLVRWACHFEFRNEKGRKTRKFRGRVFGLGLWG